MYCAHTAGTHHLLSMALGIVVCVYHVEPSSVSTQPHVAVHLDTKEIPTFWFVARSRSG